MQTFLVYKDFVESAKVLDNRRLGNQRNECMVMLKALRQGQYCMYDLAGKKYLYGNVVSAEGYQIRTTPYYKHTATQMWVKYPAALISYGMAICTEWTNRGYKDTCTEKISQYYEVFQVYETPRWLGDERLHSSHRAALLAKNYNWYSQFGWAEVPEINYFWAK